MINFSLLLPSRGRPDLVQRFLKSLEETTKYPEKLEIILCADEDDQPTIDINFQSLNVKTIVVPPGLTMGRLNRACFDASSGRYVMLVNDDIIVETQGWDQTVSDVFRSVKDEIALIHVNDQLFREKMCTFPLLSRKACLEIGLCEAEYRRYRIDDHIYDTYGMLAHIGHKRTFYLPDVFFTHENHSENNTNNAEEVFHSEDSKVYIPNQAIHKMDSDHFLATLNQRKTNAIQLAQMIDKAYSRRKRSVYTRSLNKVKDPYSCRRPEYVNCWSMSAAKKPSDTASVTVAVVTADFRQKYASKCLSLLKEHTNNFELILLDNNHSNNFNHPREMNKVLRTIRTDYLVLMDDDVYVQEGWLDGLLSEMDENVGVVAPMHKDGDGKFSFSGVYLMGDGLGTHNHLTDVPERLRDAQCLCSACLLIDMKKVGDVFFNEQYSKYFLDIDHTLRIWETGYRAVCTPKVTVTHLAGATLPHGSPVSQKLWNIDLKTFIQDWINTGRLARLEDGPWSSSGFLRQLVAIPRQINQTLGDHIDIDARELSDRMEELCYVSKPFPLFQSFIVRLLNQAIHQWSKGEDKRKLKIAQRFLGFLKDVPTISCGYIPILLETYGAYNIVEYDDMFLAVPLSLDSVDLTVAWQRSQPGILSCNSVESAREKVDKILGQSEKQQPPAPVPEEKFVVAGHPKMHREGYKGFNIIEQGGQYFAILQSEGEFSYEKVKAGEYSRVFRNSSPKGIQKDIDSEYPFLRGLKRKARRFLGRAKSGARKAINLMPRSGKRRRSKPWTIESNCDGLSIIYFQFKYFAIPSDEGPLEMSRVSAGDYSRCFTGNSVKELKQKIQRIEPSEGQSKKKAIVLETVDPEAVKTVLARLNDYDLSLLVKPKQKAAYSDFTTHVLKDAEGRYTDIMDPSRLSPQLLDTLNKEIFDLVVIPFRDKPNWQDSFAEALASGLSNRLLIQPLDRPGRFYEGEDVHRILYNKSYLSSMFRFVPSLDGKKVLDVGCSDGLVPDLLMLENPDAITGIDVLDTVGCNYSHERITYHQMDATKMDFADNSFDLCLSIATLEHVSDPSKALAEMKRVVNPGGYIYVQVGPLYYSPFGHHMFGFFDDYPWIHLRLTKDEIIKYCNHKAIDQEIRKAVGKSTDEHINSMLSDAHINGKKLEEYNLSNFMSDPDLEVLYFNESYEGQDLLTEEILEQVKPLSRDDLIAHGFELAVRVK